MYKHLYLAIFLTVLAVPQTVHANKSPSPAQLKQLREKISQLQEGIRDDLDRKGGLEQSIRDTDLKINRLLTEQKQINTKLEQAAEKLARAETAQQQAAANKHQQITRLTREIRASYTTGKQPLIKLLLNQEQPDTLARLMRYHEYLQRSRSTRIDHLSSELKELEQVVAQVKEARQEFSHQQQALERQQQKLRSARHQRKQQLEELNAGLSDKNVALARMKENEQRLQKLLEEMNATLSDIPANTSGEPFSKMAGKLPWPHQGRVRIGYGSRREGPLRWQGVLIDADQGETVGAIHPGRVVYSDWLRGYGLLLIIDHGDGYMTLYGHNESLLREVGDWVRTGETIATAGNSGGQQQAGLYFEIRKQRNTLNPARWCSRRVTLPVNQDNNKRRS